jgi:uncharacterized membrane protein YhaH (DUF805 family)
VIGALQLVVSTTAMTVAYLHDSDFPMWTLLLNINAVLLNYAARELQLARNRAYEAIADLRLSASTGPTSR